MPELREEIIVPYMLYSKKIESKTPFKVTFHLHEGEYSYNDKIVMHVHTTRNLNIRCAFSSSWGNARNYTKISTIESKMIEALESRLRTIEWASKEVKERKYTEKLIKKSYPKATYTYTDYRKQHKIKFENGVTANFSNVRVGAELYVNNVDYPYTAKNLVLEFLSTKDLSTKTK